MKTDELESEKGLDMWRTWEAEVELTFERKLGHRMILKVVSNSGQINLHGDIQRLQNLSRTDARYLQQNGRLDGTGCEDHLFPRCDSPVDASRTGREL